MSNSAFKIQYSVLSTLTASDALSRIRNAGKVSVAELRVLDLTRDGNSPIWHGVYAFFDRNGEWVYVGKNSSAQFVERIPWHFANDGGWMNRLLQCTKKHHDCKSLFDAVEHAEGFSLLLVPFERSCDRISKLERFLRVFALPRFNAFSDRVRRRYSSIDWAQPLDHVLQLMKA
jgi:hypothetical protein